MVMLVLGQVYLRQREGQALLVAGVEEVSCPFLLRWKMCLVSGEEILPFLPEAGVTVAVAEVKNSFPGYKEARRYQKCFTKIGLTCDQ